MLALTNGHRVHVDVLGPAGAPAVFLVHGLSLDGGMWFEQVPVLLQHGYRVVRMDLPGHGGSPSLDPAYTLDELAALVAGVINDLALGAVHFVGLSIGGMIGQNLALNHPELLRSALWSDTRAGYEQGEGQDWDDTLLAVAESGSLAPLVEGYLVGSISPGFIEANPAVADLLRATMRGTETIGYLACSQAIRDFDNRPHLAGVSSPVLVVCGTDDEGTPPASNRTISELVPDGRLAMIEGGRHTPNIEFPGQFNRLLIDWLAEQTARDREPARGRA
jgi:3-oxoadipate enol-lactonase